MNSITFSTFLSAAICAALIALLVLSYRRIDTTYGKGGIIIYIALLVFFPLQALIWPLSLCPFLNDADNPLTLGIGGAAYGLNYKDYVVVTLLIAAIPAASFAFLLLQSRRPLPQETGSAKAFILRLPVLLSRISAPLLCLSILLLLEYFRRDGFDRIWFSPMNRYEGALYNVDLDVHSSVLYMRIYPYFLLFSSIIASCALAFGKRKILNLCILILNALPFLLLESRGIVVVAVVGLLGWVLSLKTATARRIAILPVAAVILVVYQAPLILRALPGTGLSKIGAAVHLVRESDDYNLRNSTVMVLQSVSQSFPIFANYYREYEDGANEMDDIPIEYKLLTFSPTVSLIDGWNEKYFDMQLRVNWYTPISTWAELFLINPCLPYVVLTVFSIIVLSSIRRMAQVALGRFVFSPIIAALYLIDLAMSSQYYSRTFSRLMWVTFGVCFVFGYINKVVARRWMLKTRNAARPWSMVMSRAQDPN